MPPQTPFSEPSLNPAPVLPRPWWRRWAGVIVGVIVLLTLGAFGLAAVLNKPTNQPTTKATPSPAPGVTANERAGITSKSIGDTQLDVTSIIAQSADLGSLLAKALQVTGDVSLQSNLTVAANGTFGGTVRAQNFLGSGAGLTGVDASALGGHAAGYYQQLANLQGTLADSQLSANVALRNAPNTFTATANAFTGNLSVGNNLSVGGSLTATGPVSFSGSTSLTGTTTISSLILGSPLTVDQGGTGLTTMSAGSILYGQGGPTLGVATPAGAGECLVSTLTAVQWGSCSGAGGVASLDGLTGVLTLANSTAAGSTVTIDNATTAAKGLASFNATNFTVSSGAVNTVQNISVSSTPTFAGLNLTSALTVANGGTGAATLTSNGVLIGQGTGALTAVTAGSAGQCLISTAGAPSFQSCPGGGGVLTLNGLAGTLSVANASAAGSTITINDATTAAKGIASFNSTNFTATAGAINTIQSINTAASPTFAGLTLTGALTVANGGTGATSLAAGGVIVGQGASTLTSVTAAGAGQCLVSTAGNPAFQACPGGSSTLQNAYDNSAGGTTPEVKLSTAKGSVDIQDADTTIGTNLFNVRSSNGAGFGQILFGVGNTGAATLQNTADSATAFQVLNSAGASQFTVDTAASKVIIGTLQTSAIIPTSALTVGATAQQLTLQGNASSVITVTGGGFTTSVGFTGTPTAAVTYNFDRTASAGTYTICTTAGNCSGVGGGVTSPGGTTNKLAKFTAGTTIGDSIITDNGSTVTIGGTLAVNTITPTAALTIGATGQNLTLQGATTQLTATSGGVTNTLTFATPAASNKTITIPNATGTVAVSASGPLGLDASGNLTCATCVTSGGGSGGVGAVDSLNSLTGALTIANATTAGSTITINDATTAAKGIASFNSTNFTATAGAINTIQNINTTADPTFRNLTLSTLSVSSSQATNPMVFANNTNGSGTGNLIDLQLAGVSKFSVTPAGNLTTAGTITSGNINGQTISSAANFTGTVAVASNLTVNGNNNVITTASDATTALRVVNSGGKDVLRVDTLNNLVRAVTGTMTNVSLTSGTGGFQIGDDATANLGLDDNEIQARTNGSSANLYLQKSGGNLVVGGNAASPPARLNVYGATSSVGLLVQSAATTPGNALQIQDSSGNINAAFNGTGNQLTLGRVAGSGTVTAGSLLFADGTTDGFAATLNTSTLTANRTISFPDAAGTVCLSVGNCPGVATTLQGAYTSSTGSTTPEIKLDTTRVGIDIQDADTTITNSNNFISLRASNASGLGNILFGVGINGDLFMKPTADTTALIKVQNASAGNLLIADSTNGRVGIGQGGTITPNYPLDVGGDINTASGYRVGGSNVGTTNTCTGGNVLQNFTSVGGIVTGGSCITVATNLQGVYTGSTGGSTPEVKLDGTRVGLDIQDADTTIGTGNNFVSFRAANGAGLGNIVYGVGINGNLFMKPSADTTTLVQVQKNASSANLFVVDSTNGRVGINQGGSTLPTYTLDVGGDANLSSGSLYRINGLQITSAALSNDANLAKLNATQTFTGGTNTFQNSANSTAAFLIQNQAGRNLLSVDTTNAKISLGNITGSAGQGIAGTLVLADGTADNFGLTLNTTTLTASRTISFPDAAGTVCLQSATACNFAPSSGSANYIQNRTTAQSANLYVQASGSGTVAGVFRANAAGTGDVLDLLNGSGGSLVTVGYGGKTTFQTTTDDTLGFGVKDSNNNYIIQVNTVSDTTIVGALLVSNSGLTDPMIDSTTFGNNFYIGTANARNINIGSGTSNTAVAVSCGTGTCGFGNNAVDHSTTVGSTTGTSATTIQSGSAGISLSGNTTIASAKSLTVSAGATSLTGLAAGSSTAVAASTGAASNKGLVLQAATSQTADLTQIIDSTGAILQRTDASDNVDQLGTFNTPAGGLGQIANILRHSEQFDDALWVKTNVTAPTGDTVVAPDGQLTAESLADSASGGSVSENTGAAITNANYTFSVWLRSASGTQTVDLRIDGSTTGTGTKATVTATTTWQRFSVTQNPNGFTGSIKPVIFPGGTGGSGTVYAWGAQLAPGSVPAVYSRTGSFATTSVQSGISSGAARFQPAIDDAGAFQVLNSFSSPLFVVDTTGNGKVVIGEGATNVDSNPTLLVIDSKDTTSDPSGGVEGSMYYNDGLKTYRCYRAGYWENCGANPIDRGFTFEDEFLGGGSTSTSTGAKAQNLGALGWSSHATSSCNRYYNFASAAGAPANSHDHPGVLDLQTGTTSMCSLVQAGDSTSAGATSEIVAAGDVLKTTVALGSVGSGQVFRFGMTNKLDNTAPTSGAWLEFDKSASNNWRYCYANNAAATCASIGLAAAASTWYHLEIRINATGASTGDITYLINSGTSANVTGITFDDGTTNKLGPAYDCAATGAISQDCFIDYFQWHGASSALR